ncbi:YceI family protein [Dyadobacter sp. CY326]|uniref:YceI family protein n=1 Tax=Dyadobacter sp. CY326 TaxID=2907300 RepID=UPI001F198B25|nr:YceI family protein [Dyadobacter sp. CY326]MCE7065746.1 YceI family protein [Dyadobacter sp. CY326]
MSKTVWNVDTLHSEIQFKVKHLVISTITGSFTSFSGNAVTEQDQFENAEIAFTVDVTSVNTAQIARDEHLRSADFFDTTKYPEFRFNSNTFTKLDQNRYRLVGNLTAKGVTKLIELEAEYGGTERDSWGTLKVGFQVSGSINRKDFGITFNALTETGGLALGEKIDIIANIQLAKEI